MFSADTERPQKCLRRGNIGGTRTARTGKEEEMLGALNAGPAIE